MELTGVHVIVPVTVDAGARGFPPSLPALMTARARDRAMCPLQRKLRELVIKLRHIELYDIGLTAFVLAVTGATFTAPGVGHEAVIAAPLLDVRGNRLVTVQAQRGLAACVAAIVAIAALLFELFVSTGELSRHQ
jgi:hypothetical protein